MGGRVGTIVFDKTGTLTEDGMELFGILPYLNEKLDQKIIYKK